MSLVPARLRYYVVDAIDEWRHSPGPNVLAVATLAAVLFVAGTNLLILANVSSRVGRWKDDLRVSIYLNDDAGEADVAALTARVAAVPGVSNVVHVDKDEALRRFRAAFRELADVPSELGKNPLPASLEVVLDPGPRARDTARLVGAAASGAPPVEEVRYDQAVLDRIDAILDVARWGGASLGLVVFTAVAFVIAGVLRLTVHARRDEIEIMQLVGAPPMMVRGPFLVAGLAQGLAGSAFALFLVEAARRALRAYAGPSPAELLDMVAGSALPIQPALMIVGLGAALGIAAAWVAVRDASRPAV